MNTEEDEFRRIEAEAKRRAAQQVYTSESAESYSYRCGYEAGVVHAAIREALAQPEQQAEPVCPSCKGAVLYECVFCSSSNYPPAAQPEQEQEPVAWKLVPIEPTNEMLKAMDECSTEGYDERLYAGHAASVYMAAVKAAPTPPAQPSKPIPFNPENYEDAPF